MITFYHTNGSTERLDPAAPPARLDDSVLWLDLVRPERSEEHLAEMLLGMALPTREDLKDIEPSSRLYVEANAIYMTASLICRADSDMPELTDVAFILSGGRLVTIRYDEPKSFALFAAALERNPGKCRNGADMIARLLETIVDRTAEVLEMVVLRVDRLSTDVFVDHKAAKRRPPRYLEERLLDIARHQRLVGKVRDSLITLSRLVGFLRALPQMRKDGEASELCRIVARDIQSLAEHASFVAGNITFMLDASLGLINVEQNAIIKIFSIASVVFLPPTLVASIYGMNFRVMPELDWNYGYAAALAAMLVSAIIPFVFFRWKGWL